MLLTASCEDIAVGPINYMSTCINYVLFCIGNGMTAYRLSGVCEAQHLGYESFSETKISHDPCP